MTTQDMGSGMPTVGARVITSDGEELGKVKEISGECFKIDAPFQADYWLGTDTIVETISSGTGAGEGKDPEVRLRFTKGGLGNAKTEGMGHSGLHPHANS